MADPSGPGAGSPGDPGGNGDSRIIQTDLRNEMSRSYLEYAMSVIVGRALPDVRDGLKPVHRRVLYAMRELGNEWNKSYKKSARVVGDVIGKYHPHGDTAVYDTIVRMAQPFSMRYLLVDGQGNFGSVDGDAPAAMRYTEVRMSRIAGELLADLDRETVDFVPNYDESLTEPRVMPARYPNLLVNGSAGIAVGMATNIPPHNLTEIINACVAVIDDPAVSLAALMQHVPGPDFPTAGIINGAQEIATAYKSGRGRLSIRGRTHFEEVGSKGDRQAIVVDEWGPYDWRSPKLWPLDSTRAVPLRLRVLGPAGRWRVVGQRGVVRLSAQRGRTGDTLTVTPYADSTGGWRVELEYVGAATVSARGVRTAAGVPQRFVYERFEPVQRWTQRVFRYDERTDPFTHPAAFDSLLHGTPLLVRDASRLDWFWSRPRDREMPAERFAMEATGTLWLPAGRHTLRTLSDDAVRVWVDGTLVIDHFTPHETAPMYAEIDGGPHTVRVQYVQVSGWVELRLDMLPGVVRRSAGSAGPH